ncbi:YdiU family protein [Marinicella sp. W31]|uniref:protein adenylyltransferase SelO n=1 Tax=Marinicella sp. W31 TaxID=3023713 RepID=UPI003756E155
MKSSHSYLHLKSDLYTEEQPIPISDPKLFLVNHRLMNSLGLDAMDHNVLTQTFSGNRLPQQFKSVTLAYAGHQFGHFVPLLGDGRAHLITELTDLEGQVWDIQLKGSGQTAYSRNGDGRYALGPAIREFIMSEAMLALGVPTTQSLSVITSSEQVVRQQPQPGAVLTRVAASHIRVGTFQYAAARGDKEMLKQLSDHSIQRHFPELAQRENPYLSLLEEVIKKQVTLIVEWMRVGLIHGVMNTDNTLICGDTIDYGPCAMLGVYDPQTAYSSIDRHGRYAYVNQPLIAQWNMARFAECLLPLIADDEQQAIAMVEPLIADFKDLYEQQWQQMMLHKTGLDLATENNQKLIQDLLLIMEQKRLDYTLTFHQLTESLVSDQQNQIIKQQLGDWLQQWRQHLAIGESHDVQHIYQRMRQANPVVIPRNHHIEAVIQQCLESQSPDAAKGFLKVLQQPYEQQETTHHYQDLPTDGDAYYQTFCGT